MGVALRPGQAGAGSVPSSPSGHRAGAAYFKPSLKLGLRPTLTLRGGAFLSPEAQREGTWTVQAKRQQRGQQSLSAETLGSAKGTVSAFRTSACPRSRWLCPQSPARVCHWAGGGGLSGTDICNSDCLTRGN